MNHEVHFARLVISIVEYAENYTCATQCIKWTGQTNCNAEWVCNTAASQRHTKTHTYNTSSTSSSSSRWIVCKDLLPTNLSEYLFKPHFSLTFRFTSHFVFFFHIHFVWLRISKTNIAATLCMRKRYELKQPEKMSDKILVCTNNRVWITNARSSWVINWPNSISVSVSLD